MAYVQPTHFHGLCPVHPFPWLMSSPPISMAISYVQPTHFRGHFLYPPISVAHQFLWPFLMSTPPISMAISYIQSTHFHGNFLYPATHFHSLFLCPAHSFPCLVSSAPIFHGHFLCPAYLFPWPFLNSIPPIFMAISYGQHTHLHVHFVWPAPPPLYCHSFVQHMRVSTAISYVHPINFHYSFLCPVHPFLRSFLVSCPPISYVLATHFHGHFLCPAHPFPFFMSSPPISMTKPQGLDIARHKGAGIKASGTMTMTATK